MENPSLEPEFFDHVEGGSSKCDVSRHLVRMIAVLDDNGHGFETWVCPQTVHIVHLYETEG